METKEHVEQLLKTYHDMKRNMENLKLEMDRFSGMSYDKVIESLNFAAPTGERVQNNSVSDKPARIAHSYRDVADSMNLEILQELREQYYTLKSELDMLEHRINLLEPRISAIIWDMFILGLTWPVLCDKYNMSYATVGRYRNRGIVELVRLYDVRKAII